MTQKDNEPMIKYPKAKEVKESMTKKPMIKYPKSKEAQESMIKTTKES